MCSRPRRRARPRSHHRHILLGATDIRIIRHDPGMRVSNPCLSVSARASRLTEPPLRSLLAQGPAGATITQSAISDIRKCYQVVLELRSTSTMANRVVEVFARLVGRVDRAPEMAALRLGEQLGMDAAATSMRPLPSESNGASTPPTDNGFRLPFSTEDLSLRTFNG